MKLKKSLILAATLLVLINMSLAAEVAKTAAKGATQDIEIILDASGSMRAKIGKETKISIAKRVLVDLVESLKDRDDLALAVRIYGHQYHRRKKNCKDTKLEIPFGKPTPKKVKALVKRMKAQGWTPIAYSLLQAKKDFDLKAKRKRSIILITDGLESCLGNPCKVAAKLAAPGVNMEIHVVGFDLKKAEMKKLKCLVKPSGGLILAAKDAGQLTKALKKAIETSLGGTLKITAYRDKKRIGALVRAYKPGGKDTIKEGWIAKTKPLKLSLPPGTYDIIVRDIKVEGEPSVILSGVKIESGKTAEKSVEFSGGVLNISLIKNGKPSYGRAYIYKQGGTKREASKYLDIKRPTEFKLIPGVYDIVVEDTHMDMGKIPTVTFKDVKVKPGEIVEKIAEFFSGSINISLIRNGKPSHGRACIYKQGSTKREASKYLDIKRPTEFKLIPGVYDVEILDDKNNKKMFKGIKVKAGETKTINAEY